MFTLRVLAATAMCCSLALTSLPVSSDPGNGKGPDKGHAQGGKGQGNKADQGHKNQDSKGNQGNKGKGQQGGGVGPFASYRQGQCFRDSGRPSQ